MDVMRVNDILWIKETDAEDTINELCRKSYDDGWRDALMTTEMGFEKGETE